jgi:hypothetical protein
MLTLINPVERAEPFDRADWVFEAKFDGFRAAADTARGRLISRIGSRMQRFEAVLDLLPGHVVFDGELAVLDDTGRPLLNELRLGRRRPTYVAFDFPIADLPLARGKAMLAARGPRGRLRSATASSAKGGRRTGPWPTPTWRASPPSLSPRPTTRSLPGHKVRPSRSVAAAPSGCCERRGGTRR